jgi:hypothetical protein
MPCLCLPPQINAIDQKIELAILATSPRNWDEDYITRTWLEALLNSPSCFSSKQGLQVAFDAYKMNGNLEKSYGDIAVLVKLSFPNKKSLTGVGFLEAKRIYQPSNTYEALRAPQLKKMNQNSPHHKLLLYDFNKPTIASGVCWNAPHHFPFCSNKAVAIVVPTAHALAYGKNDSSLAIFSWA